MKTGRLSSVNFSAFARKGLKTEKSLEVSGRRENSFKEKSSRARDYHLAELNAGTRVMALLKSAAVVAVLTIFFYRSILAAIPLSFIGFLFYKKNISELAGRDRQILESQFGEAIHGVETALKAGYSVENAFIQSGRDMGRQFGEESFIFREMEVIRRGLIINITLEEMLADLAARSGSEAIEDFANVFAIAKRFGGNMPEVISTSARTIALQIETREEIMASLSGRRMEQNIMKIMPFGILTYVSISSPGYFDPLYENATGILVMTGLLAVYLAAYFIGDRILGKLEEGA